jgi:hypothetical protein
MSAPNFMQAGNGGLNVIKVEDDFDLTDTLENIIDSLEHEGFTVLDTNAFTSNRSYNAIDSGKVLYNNKVVGYYEVVAGYYADANINVYTVRGMSEGDKDEFEDDLRIYDQDKGWIDYREGYTIDKKLASKFVKAIQENTTQLIRTALFSNGEAMYEVVK